MRPNPNLDEFDTGFDAADDFAFPAETSWADNAIADIKAEAQQGPRPEASGAPAADPGGFDLDPFADLPPAQPARGEVYAEVEASAPEAGYATAGVPRISIQVFAEKPRTAAVIDQASRDRRMSRASTQVRSGGLAAAVAYYQNQPTPPLVVVESSDRGEGLVGLLDQLAEVCDPGTKVMVVGASNDIALYRELMRRGVSEYLVPPLDPVQFITAVVGLYADPSTAFTGRQIAFAGVKGGVGASTVAHNFAYSLSERMQTNTVVADFDLAFGTAGLDFNQDPLQGVATALSQPDRLDPVLLERMMARCSDRLSLFAAPATLDEDYEFGPDAAEEVTAKMRSTAPFVVLDLPHMWSAWMRRILLSSDEVVLVAAPDLASLRNAKNMVDLLRQSRPNDAPPRLVLNQVGVPGRPEIPVKDFSAALGLQPALVLPFDPKLFGKAANNGQMVHEVAPKSKAAEGFDFLAHMITRREAAPAAKASSLTSLFKRK